MASLTDQTITEQTVTDKEFQTNQQGIITPRQKQFVFRQFLGECLLFVVCGALFSFLLFSQEWLWGVGVLAILLVVLGRTIYVYGPELLQSPAPQHVAGEIYTVQNRQSYQIAIDGVGLHASKAMWRELEHGAHYEMFYSPRSKWLLSYRRVNDKDEAES